MHKSSLHLMAPYPHHSSTDSALRSKRPVNRTGPLLHRGFGADRKALPIFLVFHPPEAGQAQHYYVSRSHNVCSSGSRDHVGKVLDNPGHSHQ